MEGDFQLAKFHRVNQFIQAAKLRVLDFEGKLIGVLSKDEALAKAKAEDLDLVEIAPNALPPVAKIIDFKKFKYDLSKKERGTKKGSEGGLKELWLSPRIDEHDLKVRIARTQEFLKHGYKVKLTVKFKGREMAHPENGRAVLNQTITLLGEGVGIEREAKFEGRNLSIIVTKQRAIKVDKTDGGNSLNNQV